MLQWFRKLLPREDKFFDLFEHHSKVAVAAANEMCAMLAGEGAIEAHCHRIVDLEEEADNITRDVLLAVRRSFITPFDRGDIKDLIQSMDDAVDMLNKTVKTIRRFEQRSFEPGMQEMGRLIAEAARLNAEAVPLLVQMGTNSARISALTEEMTRIEGRSDELYEEGLKNLFRTHGANNAMAYLIGSEIYGELEKVVDRFEDVANEINGIVIENV
jgi:predicted phosphate transport protein (TIGR00153 family)